MSVIALVTALLAFPTILTISFTLDSGEYSQVLSGGSGFELFDTHFLSEGLFLKYSFVSSKSLFPNT